jgi:uncharacterized OB-fold protein
MLAAPAPDLDDDSRPYWDGLRHNRIVLQQCSSCTRQRFPPMPSCPWCGAVGHDFADVTGTGRVYSWVTAHRALGDSPEKEVPYTVAVIAFVGGVRLLGRLDGEAALDAHVEPIFIDHDGWTELSFRRIDHA